MTEGQTLGRILSRSFCEEIAVHAVPAGFAVSTPFTDNSGDRITFYVREADNGFVLEDDGSFLSHLIASGIDIDRGQRQALLDNVLSSADAYWDKDSFEIRSKAIARDEVGHNSVKFLSALLRVRDIELLTKQLIRSTFREDAIASLRKKFDGSYAIEERASLGGSLNDFPADVVLRPHTSGKQAAVFFVSSATQFLEAEILHSEIKRANLSDRFGSIALIEDIDKINQVGLKRYQRAVNRGLPTPIYRGDEDQAMNLVQERLAA